MKEKTDGVKRRKYDASFREEVVKMVLNGRPVSEVAQSPGIGENLIYRWKSLCTGRLIREAIQLISCSLKGAIHTLLISSYSKPSVIMMAPK